MSLIKAILFDYDDTLTSGPISWYYPYNELKEKFGFSAKEIEKSKEYEAVAYQKYYRYPESIKINTREKEYNLHRQVYSEWLHYIGREQKETLVEYLVKRRMEEIEFKLFPEVEVVLRKLFPTYKLGVISNALPSRQREIAESPVAGFFSVVLLSNLLGTGKPAKEIYLLAQKELGLETKEVMFVDDRLQFLAPAAELGMTVAQLKRNSHEEEGSFPVINNLNQLFELLR